MDTDTDTADYELRTRDGTGERRISQRLKKQKAELKDKLERLDRQRAENEQREDDLARLQRQNEEEERAAAAAGPADFELNESAKNAVADLIAAENLPPEVTDRILAGALCNADLDILVSDLA